MIDILCVKSTIYLENGYRVTCVRYSSTDYTLSVRKADVFITQDVFKALGLKGNGEEVEEGIDEDMFKCILEYVSSL